MDNQSLADEHAVLSGIFKNGYDLFLDVSYLTSNSFTIDSNQVIFKCIKKIYDTDHNAELDGSAVLSAANSLGYGKYFTENQNNTKHLRAILNTPVTATTARSSGAKVRKLEIARLLSAQLTKINADIKRLTGDESVLQILNLAEQPILDFSSLVDEGESTPFILGSKSDDYLKNIELNPNASIGIPSGLDIYDDTIGGGFRRKNVSIIGARAKAGKTFLGMNIAYNVTKEGLPVLFLDTEMSEEEQTPRILSRISEKVRYRDIEHGTFLKNDFQKDLVRKANATFKKLPLHYLSIPGQPFEETLSVMRRWVRRKVGIDKNGRTKPCLIILDYFKVMDSKSITQSLSEFQLLGFMLTSMQAFAAKFDVPILTFIQLNRDGLDKENEAAASGSDRITWFCSNFTIFKRKTQEEIAASGGPLNGNRKLVPVISRHGPGLDEGDYINVYANLDFATILEKQTRNQTAADDPGDPTDKGFDTDEDIDV